MTQTITKAQFYTQEEREIHRSMVKTLNEKEAKKQMLEEYGLLAEQ